MATILITSSEKNEGYECYWWWEKPPAQGVLELRGSWLERGYPAVVRVAEALVQMGGGWQIGHSPPILERGWIVSVGDIPSPREARVSRDRLVSGDWAPVDVRRVPLDEWPRAVKAILGEMGMEQEAPVF